MDYSVIVSQGEGTSAAPGGPPHGGADPQMAGHIAQIEQLSRIRRLNNVDLIHSRCLRMNFRDDYRDDGYVHSTTHRTPPNSYPENDGPMGPPPPAYRSLPPGPPPPRPLPPPPPPRHIPRGPMRRPPPPIYLPPGPPAPGYGPPEPPLPSDHHLLEHPPVLQHHGGPPGGLFVDENPNTCAVM